MPRHYKTRRYRRRGGTGTLKQRVKSALSRSKPLGTGRYVPSSRKDYVMVNQGFVEPFLEDPKKPGRLYYPDGSGRYFKI